MPRIGSTYKISEPTVSHTIRRVEDILMKSGSFTLPGKKKVEPSDMVWQFMVIHTTETLIERPKKATSIQLWKEEMPQHKIPSKDR